MHFINAKQTIQQGIANGPFAPNWESLKGYSIPWKIFGEGPTQIETGSFTDTHHAAFTSQDIRFTTRNNLLYATFLDWPANGSVTIKTLATDGNAFKQRIEKVEILGHREALQWRHDTAGLTVELPANKPCEHAFVLKISPMK